MKKKDKVCKAPNSDGKPCKGKVIAKGFCNRHYRQVYEHGRITNKPLGRDSEERDKLGKEHKTIKDKVQAELKKYHGKDALYDISNKLEAEGFDRVKIRKAIWHVLREPKKKSGSR